MRQNPLGIGIGISNLRARAAMGAARVLSRLARDAAEYGSGIQSIVPVPPCLVFHWDDLITGGFGALGHILGLVVGRWVVEG